MPKEHPNRILEIARSNKWTWAIVTNNHFIVIDQLPTVIKIFKICSFVKIET